MADEDWHAITLDARTTYRIDVKGSESSDSGGDLADPSVRLVSADGIQVPHQSDRDSGAGENARLTYTANRTGTYYVAVGEDGDDAGGTYTVTATEVTTTVRVTQITEQGLVLYWDAPADTQDLEEYIVEYREHGETAWSTAGEPTSAVRVWPVYQLASMATYQFQVTPSYSGNVLGNVLGTIQLTLPDCDADTGTWCGILAPSSGNTASIGAAGDEDWHRVELEDTTAYRIDVAGAGGSNPLADAHVRLLDHNGNDLSPAVEAGDDNTDNDASVEFLAPSAGVYYIAVSDPGDDGTGDYSLAIDETADETVSETPGDDLPETTATTGVVVVGAPAEGSISPAGDADWFKLVLLAGYSYRIDVVGGNGSGELAEPVVALLDAGGDAVEVSGSALTDADADGDGTASISFAPDANGFFFVQVAEDGDDGVGTTASPSSTSPRGRRPSSRRATGSPAPFSTTTASRAGATAQTVAQHLPQGRPSSTSARAEMAHAA